MPIQTIDPLPPAETVYTGVGSRDTPSQVLDLMEDFAEAAAEAGWVLRSGGADGADSAFERGCDRAEGRKRVFYSMGKDISESGNPNGKHHVAAGTDFLDLAEDYHPAWDRLSGYVRRLMARNGAQVLGPKLGRPTNILVCWTPDGATATTTQETGGTGQAIRIAVDYCVPVVNLYWEESRVLIKSLAEQFAGGQVQTGNTPVPA